MYSYGMYECQNIDRGGHGLSQTSLACVINSDPKIIPRL